MYTNHFSCCFQKSSHFVGIAARTDVECH